MVEVEGRWLERHWGQHSSSGNHLVVELGVADGQLVFRSQSEPLSVSIGPTRLAN